MAMIKDDKKLNQSTVLPWLKKIGVVGFLFFLIKGLVWIGIAAIAFYSAKD